MPQVIIIKRNNKTVYVGLNTDVTPKQYESLVAEAEKHRKEAEEEKKALLGRLSQAEEHIKELRHEIAVDRGEEE